jgi:hypothetical protein
MKIERREKKEIMSGTMGEERGKRIKDRDIIVGLVGFSHRWYFHP